jgi:hypothetical protein
MKLQSVVIDGKRIRMRIRMTHDRDKYNIEINPLEAPKSNFFRIDNESNYVFSNPTSIKEVREVYRILTEDAFSNEFDTIGRAEKGYFTPRYSKLNLINQN